MLIAIYFTIMSLFGASNNSFGVLMTQYAEDQFKVAIADEDRRKLALAGLSTLEGDLSDINKNVEKNSEQLQKLIKDYQSTAGDFDQLFTATLALRRQQLEKLWQDRNAMLKHVTAEEWSSIIKGAMAAAEAK
jgi:hypothetical protein